MPKNESEDAILLRRIPNQDDPVFAYMLQDVLKPYIIAAREWWKEFEFKSFPYTACFLIKDGPPGFFEKCTRSPLHSPIYGIQAFPCASVAHLKLQGRMPGGAIRMIEYTIQKGMEIEEFTLIMKKGLHSTLSAGRFICFIPTVKLNERSTARWFYLKAEEVLELVNGIVTPKLIERLLPYAKEYRGEVTEAYKKRYEGLTGRVAKAGIRDKK